MMRRVLTHIQKRFPWICNKCLQEISREKWISAKVLYSFYCESLYKIGRERKGGLIRRNRRKIDFRNG